MENKKYPQWKYKVEGTFKQPMENGLVEGYIENRKLCDELKLYANLDNHVKSRGITQ